MVFFVITDDKSCNTKLQRELFPLQLRNLHSFDGTIAGIDHRQHNCCRCRPSCISCNDGKPKMFEHPPSSPRTSPSPSLTCLQLYHTLEPDHKPEARTKPLFLQRNICNPGSIVQARMGNPNRIFLELTSCSEGKNPFHTFAWFCAYSFLERTPKLVGEI